MSSIETKPAFLQRFDRVWSKMRRTQIGQGICWGLLIAAVGFAIVAAIDYRFEVGLSNRSVGLGIVGVVALGLTLTWIVRTARRWSRPKTATEIEKRFPELGQAVRTSVEFGDRSSEALKAEGIQPDLVGALADDAERRAAPLKIDSIVPVRRLRLAAGLALAVILILVGVVAWNWEWRVAAMRALLDDRPYTELAVSPGNLTIDEGQSLSLSIDVAGRTDRSVIVATRPAGSDEKWSERKLTSEDEVAAEPQLVKYETTLTNIAGPIEYRVTAGPAESDIYRVNVRHPLAIESIRAEIAPPAYTGVEPSTVEDGNLNVINGSTVQLNIELDRAPKSAKLVMTERGVGLGPGDSPQVQEIPLHFDDATLSTTLTLTRDQTYSIVAEADDGMKLPDNKFRIRVRMDQPPEVWFEEPDEALEVHSIAEVLLRVRTRDDFGLTRAGIVFEVNNEEEYTLLEKDYREIAAALSDGQPAHQTRDALQRLLPLELFGLEEKDSVTYYAFAEDSFPDGTHYTETDLRFIDIRPFRRVYRLPDPNAPNGGGNGPQVRSLQEIIARQRFNLNRTIRVDRKAEMDKKPTLVEVDRIARFEDDLSKSTHELAEFLDEREFDGSDLLFQAETVMLTSVDSLNVGKYDISSQQQKDALRLLIEARNTIEIFLRQSANAAQRNALRSFDRQQIQKLRRPQQDSEDEEDPEQLVERIRRLADEQDFVYKTLASNLGGGTQENVQPAEVEGTKGQSDNPLAKDGEGGNSDSEDMSDENNTGMSRAETEQRQQEIALEARDIEGILNRLRNMSELARQRGSAAADETDNVSGALARGSTDEAAETARQARGLLRELALNVEGVMAAEPSEKIAMSRDLAGMLAALERRLAEAAEGRGQESEGRGQESEDRGQGAEDRDQQADEASAGGPDEAEESDVDRKQELARRAARLAESGKTMEDILDSVIETNSPGDREAVRQVDEVLAEGKVDEAVQRMADVPRMLEEGRNRDARVEAEGVADRLEVTARQLDQVYRSIVTPRVEQLTGLEGRAVQLEKDLQELETNEQISNWHREALDLLDELDKGNAARRSLDELYEVMQAKGWSKMLDRRRWGWTRGEDNKFLPPDGYSQAVRAIVEELQQQIQELILTDLVADDNEATPPRYKHLVERYIEVLSSDARE